MKRYLCILLCLLLALPLTGQADSIEGKTILEIMERQIEANASYRVQLSGTAQGSAPCFIGEDVWAMLCQLLPGVSLRTTYVRSKSGATLGNTQTRLKLYSGEEKLSTLTVSGWGDRCYLSGDPLGDQVLSFPRDPNSLSMMLFPAEENGWPSLDRAFWAVLSADAEWQDRLDAALEPYNTLLTAWLQQNTQMSITRDESGAMLTLSASCFTVQQTAKEAIELLRVLYQDDTMLSLLRERLSEEEANAYLEPGMLPLFVSALEQVSSEQQLTLTRTYTSEGSMVSEVLDLPFAEGGVLSHLTLEATENTQAVTAVLSSGGTLHFTLETQGAGVYAGEFSYAAADADGFAGTYLFTASLGEEQYDATNTGKERSQQHRFSLLIQPAQGQTFPSQLLKADVSLTGGASTDDSIGLDIDFSYTQPGTDTSLALKYHSRTSSMLNQADVDTENAVALDSMTLQELTDYIGAHSEALIGNLTALLGQIQPAAQ